MNPLLLGGIVALATVLVLFSSVSVALGLLIVSAGFLLVFDGVRSLELMPEIFFGKLDSLALLSIPMFIIMDFRDILHPRRCRSLRGAGPMADAHSRWTRHFQPGCLLAVCGHVRIFTDDLCRHRQDGHS